MHLRAALCALFLLFLCVSAAFPADVRGEALAAGGSKEAVMEVSTGRVLHDVRSRERAYPASTTKILTALVVLETLPLELEVTVPREAAGVEGSSVYLREGETLRERLVFVPGRRTPVRARISSYAPGKVTATVRPLLPRGGRLLVTAGIADRFRPDDSAGYAYEVVS